MVTYVKPERKIMCPMDLPKWLASQAYADYVGFVDALNTSVKRKTNSSFTGVDQSESILALTKLLDSISVYIDQIVPINQPQRFGNKAYRDWYDKLSENCETLIGTVVTDKQDAIVELSSYLMDSFGNRTRIDYGTGHEACFVIFLLCLFKLEVLKQSDAPLVVSIVFNKYVKLCRKLQDRYRMEPAGSHGVWSLDDYQFLPFLWGSAQLIDNPYLQPSSFADQDLAAKEADETLFMGCIDYIFKVKTGPFSEHSNQLWNISGVPHWTKVNQGLMKMYKAEVLGKFPVIQHFVFGSLFSISSK